MATLPNPLPRLASLGLQLPPGELVDATDDGPWHEPLLWLTDGRAAPDDWVAVRATAPGVGLLPVVLDVGAGHEGPRHWDLMPAEVSYPGDHDAEEVLEELWDECAEADADWPGLADARDAADPDSVADDIVNSLLDDGSPLKDPASPSSRPAAAPTSRPPSAGRAR